MKTQKSSSLGVALVIVLGFLVIISALSVAFFSSVQTELKASRNFSSTMSTKQLAESAVQLVMGQIREGTVQPNASWASQPGMIRTYGGTSIASANAQAFYKLYSSPTMTLTATSDMQNYGNQPDYEKAWQGMPAHYTDINSPVLAPDPANPGGAQLAHFPIIDPRSKGVVEGFDFTTTSVNGTVSSVGTDARLPMPVSWIYVLQDGTLTAPNKPTSGATTIATWNSGGTLPGKVAPSAANPIVGRIAFWTDDETSKVNLNTAGGFINGSGGAIPSGYTVDSFAGSFWDTPRALTNFEQGIANPASSGYGTAGKPTTGGGGLAICQLLQNEFQRYPGHPATTSLGLVFTNATTGASFLTSEQLYQILPRLGTTNSQGISPGSSVGGTNRIIIASNTPAGQNPLPDNLQLQPKRDRLYASVDELLFAADNSSATPSSPTYARRTNDAKLSLSNQITPTFIDQMRFFLTAQSRAPELNLFGQPRVTLWPVRYENVTEVSGLNPFDNVILFCSTVGPIPNNTNGRQNTSTVPSSPLQTGLPTSASQVSGPYRYIFTRREVASTSLGTNVSVGAGLAPQALFSDYASSNLTNPSTNQDIYQGRNMQLMSYLNTLTNKPIPGFGGSSFSTKYQTYNLSQTLTEIFDYIRCANLQDTTTYTLSGTTGIKFAPLGVVEPSRRNYLTPGSTVQKGFGRFPTISEASIVFYYAGPKMTAANLVDLDTDAGNLNKVKTRSMGAFLLFSTFNPMQGYAPVVDPGQNDPKMSLELTGMDTLQYQLQSQTGPSFFSFPKASTSGVGATPSTVVYRSSGGTWGGRNFGGFEGFMHTLVGNPNTTNGVYPTWAPAKIKTAPESYNAHTLNLGAPDGNWCEAATTQAPPVNQEWYQFQTITPVQYPVVGNGTSFVFSGGTLNLTIKYGGRAMQTIPLFFPRDSICPLPLGDPNYDLTKITDPSGNLKDSNQNWSGQNPANWLTSIDANVWKPMQNYYWEDSGSFYPFWKHAVNVPSPRAARPTYLGGSPDSEATAAPNPWIYQSRLQAAWSFASRLAWSTQPSYSSLTNSTGSSKINHYSNRWKQILQPGDTIRSLLYCENVSSNTSVIPTPSGDLRVAALQTSVPAASAAPKGSFQPHPEYNSGRSRACSLRTGSGTMYFPSGSPAATGWSTNAAGVNLDEMSYGNHVSITGGGRFPASIAMGNLPFANNTGVSKGINGVLRGSDNKVGDFDTGVGNFPDGPFTNKQDEGNVIYAYQDPNTGQLIYPVPYFGTWAYEAPGNTFTSPSRQVPSAVMLGSLLSQAGAQSATSASGWETLAFCPNTLGTNHHGNDFPKDHLLLDLFQMPVVEPYPISEPFSTAGKVNLNYPIAPFDYITRTTAVRAALHPLRIMAIPNTDYDKYKTGVNNSGVPLATNYRIRVDRNETIKELDSFFAAGKSDINNGLFKSATQICEQYLYPIGTTFGATNMVNWWSTNGGLSGDNVREKPYADLYPRLTTKSNTYCVHFRVQTLRQLPRDASSDPNGYGKWNEGRDQVLGEYRGSTIIERYIDPADSRLDQSTPSTFTCPDTTSLETLYRFRSVMNKKFTP